MPRPKTKAELQAAASENYEKLNKMIENMSTAELSTPFDFSDDEKKTEAHWARDKNLRDVLVHLYEWQLLLLKWIPANLNGENIPFLPPPYNWKTYGDMNVEIWEKHQDTPLEKAKQMLDDTHDQVIKLIGDFDDGELFEKKHYSWTGSSNLGSYFISVTSSHYDWAMKKLKAHKRKVAG